MYLLIENVFSYICLQSSDVGISFPQDRKAAELCKMEPLAPARQLVVQEKKGEWVQIEKWIDNGPQ